MMRSLKPAPPKNPMSDATRVKRKRFKIDDVFLSLHQRFSCEGYRLTRTSLGITVMEYELQARCCDCRTTFSQYATRSRIRRDALRRRCDDCKRPGRMTTPILARRMAVALALAPQKAAAARQRAAEARREALANAPPSRQAITRSQRIAKLSEQTGEPVPANISLHDLFDAEQRHIRNTRRAYQQSAKMLGVRLSEIAKIDRERRARQRAAAT